MRPPADLGTPAAAEPVRVVALSGSLRTGSHTRKALAVAVEGARKLGAEVTVVDLGEWKLPAFDGDPSRSDPEALRFRAAVKAADALLIATPVYHDSLGGMLKNALDLLYEELAGKVAAVIAVGGGRQGQGQALEHLRAVLRETQTWVLPRQVIVPDSEKAFDEAGKATDPEVGARLSQLGQEVVLRSKVLRPRKRA